jgi:hypothetical protein
VRLLLPGAGLYQRMAALAAEHDPTTILVTTPAPLLEARVSDAVENSHH